MEPAKEIISLADKNGNPIAVCERHAPRPEGCFTQIAAVFILNSKGNLILQKRSAFKSKDALKWSFSAGGHVNADETYEQAAIRELKEEMGIETTIVSYIGQTRALVKNNIPKSFVKAFLVHHNGPFTFDPQEVHEVKEFTLDELTHLITEKPELFKQTFIDIFYQFINPYGRQVHDLLKQFSAVFSGKKTALDIGCAVGINAFYLAQQNITVTAVDKKLPPDKIENPLIAFEETDVCGFSFKQYDIILALNVLQFINKEKQSDVLENIFQSLNNNGVLFINAFAQTDPTYNHVPYIQGHFAPNELKDWAVKHSLEIIFYAEETFVDNHPPHGEHRHGFVRLVAKKKI